MNGSVDNDSRRVVQSPDQSFEKPGLLPPAGSTTTAAPGVTADTSASGAGNVAGPSKITAARDQGLDTVLPDTPGILKPTGDLNLSETDIENVLQQAQKFSNLAAATLVILQKLESLIDSAFGPEDSPGPEDSSGASDPTATVNSQTQATASKFATGSRSDAATLPPLPGAPAPNAMLAGSFYTTYIETISGLAKMMSQITRENAAQLVKQMQATAEQAMLQFKATIDEGNTKAAQFKALAANDLMTAVVNLTMAVGSMVAAGVTARMASGGNAAFKKFTQFSDVTTRTFDNFAKWKNEMIQAGYAPELANLEANKSFYGQYVRMSQDFEATLKQNIGPYHDQIQKLFEALIQNIRTMKSMVWKG